MTLKHGKIGPDMLDIDDAYDARDKMQAARDKMAEELCAEYQEVKKFKRIEGHKKRWVSRQIEGFIGDARREQRRNPSLNYSRLFAEAQAAIAYAKEPITDYGYCGPDDMEADRKAQVMEDAIVWLSICIHC